jgi:IS5 family transposase
MEAVVPWKVLIGLIEPYYPRSSRKGGRPPYPLNTMLRIYLLQQWCHLTVPAMEDALTEVAMMRCSPALSRSLTGSRTGP